MQCDNTAIMTEETLSLKKPKAIIFDWDNTLVDSWPVIHHALNETLTKWNKAPWTMEETRRRVRKSMRDAFPELFGDEWKEAGDYYRSIYRSLHMTNLHPMPGAAGLIEAIDRLGIMQGIISNKTSEILRREVAALKWGEFFSTVIGSGDLNVDKPSPEPVYKLLENTGISPAETWFVGDSVIDVECARASGCVMVFYGNDFDYDKGHLTLRAGEAHVTDHKTIMEHLNRICIHG